MVSPRIWVSCAVGENAQQGIPLAQRLISDLRNAGAEVVSESAALPDEQFLPFLQQELASCQWFILVQTPQGMGSRRTQLAIQEALSCLKEGSLRGACLVNALSDGWDEAAPGPEMRSYTYQGDYPRLRDKLLLDLDLLQVTGLLEEEKGETTVGTFPSYPVQEMPGFYQQTTESTQKPAPFQERSGEMHKLPSTFQAPSSSGSLRQMGSMTSQHAGKVTRGDQPPPPPLSIPKPSRRFWLYSLVSIFSLVLLVSGVVLAQDMTPQPSHAAHATPITSTRPSPTHAAPTQPAPTNPAPAQPAPTQPAPAGSSSSPSPIASQDAGWVFITTSSLSVIVLDQAGNSEGGRCSQGGGTAMVPPGSNVVVVDNNAYQIRGLTYLHVAYPDPCQPGQDYSPNNAIANGTGAVGWMAVNALAAVHMVHPQPPPGGGVTWRDCWGPNLCADASYPNRTDTLPAKDAELYAWWTGSYWDVHWWHVRNKSGKEASVYGRDWGAF
jgi:hypothetical protein